jgi:hypothetical protein
MNKLLILVGALAMIACTNHTPVIHGPYEIESVDLKNDVAAIKSGDLVLEVEFDPMYFKDGNGYASWNEFTIHEVKNVKVFNEDGETEKYVLPSEEVSNIVNLIEKEVAENLE